MNDSLSSPRLPSDVIKEILDLLEHDHETLSNFSLVSKAWVHPSRSLLFRRLRIDVTEGDILNEIPHSTRFLQSPPSVCGLVKVLEIVPGQIVQVASADLEDQVEVFDTPVARIRFSALAFILSKLPRLEVLRISVEVSCEGQGASDLPGPFKLSKLSLESVYPPSFGALTLFSAVNKLEIGTFGFGDEDWEDPDSEEPGPPAIPPPLPHDFRVESLMLQGLGIAEHFLDALRSTSAIHTLTSLEIEFVRPSEFVALGKLLRDVAPNLTRFCFESTQTLPDYLVSPEEWQQLNLSHCMSLRCIELTVLFPYSRGYPEWDWSQVLSLISSFPPSLKDLKIMFATFAGDTFDLSIVNWRDTRLVLANFPQLEKVLLDFSEAEVEPNRADEFFSKQFPELANQGQMKVRNPNRPDSSLGWNWSEFTSGLAAALQQAHANQNRSQEPVTDASADNSEVQVEGSEAEAEALKPESGGIDYL